MRVIDADEVLNLIYDEKVIETNSNEVAFNDALEVAIQIIDTQKTVKAIPIEWINSYTTGLIFSDDYEDNADSIDDYIYCIKEMVRDWKKENEM